MAGGLFLFTLAAVAVAECRAGYIHDVGITFGSASHSGEVSLDHAGGTSNADTSGSATGFGLAGEHCLLGVDAGDLYLGWTYSQASGTIERDETTAFYGAEAADAVTSYSVQVGWRW